MTRAAEPIRQNLSYEEAIAFRADHKDVRIARAEWSDWIYVVELHPYRREVRTKVTGGTQPLTFEDYEAKDWFASLYPWIKEPKQWFTIGPFGDVSVYHLLA